MTVKTWVLIRGLTREARHWYHFTPALAQYFPNTTILTPDLPGCGKRYKERAPIHVKDAVERVRDTLTIEGPIGIIGTSLGGMVALEWAHRYPGEVERIVIVNSSSRSTSPMHHRFTPSGLSIVWTSFRHARNSQKREEAILKVTSTRHYANKPLIANFATFADTRPMTRFNAWRQVVMAWRFALPDIHGIPLLCASAPNDKLVKSSCHRAIAKHYDARLVENCLAGHDLALDEPMWLAKQIALFCREE